MQAPDPPDPSGPFDPSDPADPSGPAGPADPLIPARAAVLHDLAIDGHDDAHGVSLLEDAVTDRRWWVSQWPDGSAYVAGLVAQDVQDALFDAAVRWPRCRACDRTEPHELRIHPELGPDPQWVCELSGITVAPLGAL